MAPVIWGLNLGEIQWSKFKSSYMWNNEYHLRRTKFIVYVWQEDRLQKADRLHDVQADHTDPDINVL